MFEEKFFARKKADQGKLIQYGFTEESNGCKYTAAIMDGQLELTVFISQGGAASTKVIDILSNEEYTLYKVESSAGAYVGKVRAACESVLADIAQKCCEPDVFHGSQTTAIIQYVREKYGDELEFLWEKFSENAVLRRKDNQKWYGLVIAISKRKLGLDSDEIIEAIDLRLRPEQMEATIDNIRYFPGWHMNKKSWYTVILDGSVPLEEICRRIDESYILAVK